MKELFKHIDPYLTEEEAFWYLLFRFPFLSDSEQAAVIHRWGLFGESKKSYKDIAKIIPSKSHDYTCVGREYRPHITHQRARQLECNGLRKLYKKEGWLTRKEKWIENWRVLESGV